MSVFKKAPADSYLNTLVEFFFNWKYSQKVGFEKIIQVLGVGFSMHRFEANHFKFQQVLFSKGFFENGTFTLVAMRWPIFRMIETIFHSEIMGSC